MAVCSGSKCMMKSQCKNYEGNYFDFHEETEAEVIDWSVYGHGTMVQDAGGKSYCKVTTYCGDDGEYRMIDEISWTLDYQNCIDFASKYYNEETLAHVKRVAQYVKENDCIPDRYRLDCMCLAILHDILEDTDCDKKSISVPESSRLYGRFMYALEALTKEPDQDYIDYISNIKRHTNTVWGKCAWWVKLADMKDHLAQTETLTDRLRDKYVKALSYLL